MKGPSCDATEVTINMFDSYGDGGGSVTVGGVTLLNEGYGSSAVVCVDLSECSAVDYEATDSWPEENSWSITDADGNILAEGGNASGSFRVQDAYLDVQMNQQRTIMQMQIL